MNEGLIDTNVFIHAQTRDGLSEECNAFLDLVASGQLTVILEPIVLHELSYAWNRVFRNATRQDVANYMLTILVWPGIAGNTQTLYRAVRRWRDSSADFVDCLLAERALRDNVPVYTKNVRDIGRFGVGVPDPLPR
jgi:predicted nucleic acid-binding protein